MPLVLITGADGFIGRNLRQALELKDGVSVLPYDVGHTAGDLSRYAREAEFVFHLAGVNRPKNETEFVTCNVDFTSQLLSLLRQHRNRAPIVMSSSIQAAQDNPYGRSKKKAEELVIAHGVNTGCRTHVYRLPNLFGKWCRPNYNSVVATFCHNIANQLEIQISDPEIRLTLAYIDDVVEEFINALDGKPCIRDGFGAVETIYEVALGRIAELLHAFQDSRSTLQIPDMSDSFVKKLYATYTSYLPRNRFCYPLKMNVDDRGSFTEFLKSPNRGQVSINVSRPGITKGNHWHHTKTEKFLVVSGEGLVRFRKIGSGEVIEYRVSGGRLEVVDIPVGYTHNIINTGTSDLITVMWANEVFDRDQPDTFLEEVCNGAGAET